LTSRVRRPGSVRNVHEAAAGTGAAGPGNSASSHETTASAASAPMVRPRSLRGRISELYHQVLHEHVELDSVEHDFTELGEGHQARGSGSTSLELDQHIEKLRAKVGVEVSSHGPMLPHQHAAFIVEIVAHFMRSIMNEIRQMQLALLEF